MKFPEGKFLSTIKIGEKGQIVIPKEVRDMFDLKPNDTVFLLADKERGIAIVNNDEYQKIADAILERIEK